MSGRCVCLAGAGNIRCCPAVLGALSLWFPEGGVLISLFEANEERLDLMDRLARVVLEEREDIVVRASSDLDEALAGVTDLILMLNEDGSRRMVGGSEEVVHDMGEGDSVEFRRGDGNRPTPVEQLSPLTRQVLSRPAVLGGSREEVVRAAGLRVLDGFDGRVCSLIRSVDLEVDGFDWPQPLSESELWMRPHEILRWISGDERLETLVEAGRSGPILGWLD